MPIYKVRIKFPKTDQVLEINATDDEDAIYQADLILCELGDVYIVTKDEE